MAKAPRVRKGFLYAGAAALLLAFLFRKNVAQSAAAAGSLVTETLSAPILALLRSVEKLPIKPGVPYHLLPPGPPEIGPLAPNTSLDALELSFRAKVERLEPDLALILQPHGITPRHGETRRTWARQTYLYGIGRAYQAAGRTGTVTNALQASGNHPKGKAIDFNYYKGGRYLGSKEDSEMVRKLIAPHVARLEATYKVKWGGTWSKPDVPHWEDVVS